MLKPQSFTPSQLRQLRSEVEKDFAWLLCSMTHTQANGASSVNRVSHLQSRSEADEFDAALQDQAQDRLAAVTAALRRLDTGGYGECARCGSRISFGRLAEMPEATRCTACGGT
ncbi:MAG: TraR/DksA C4-type zinc finger protein [Gemmatimonadaceae bacterium]